MLVTHRKPIIKHYGKQCLYLSKDMVEKELIRPYKVSCLRELSNVVISNLEINQRSYIPSRIYLNIKKVLDEHQLLNLVN